MIFELVTFESNPATLRNLARYMIPSNAVAIVAAGQSNMRVNSRDETSGSNKNGGELAIVAEMQVHYPTNPCFYVCAAVSGTNLDDDPSGPSWMQVNGGSFRDGEYLTQALEIIDAYASTGARIAGFVWNQGENDQGGPTIAEWKERLLYILNRMRTVQAAPIGLIEPANRTVVAAGYEVWRTAFRELAAENAYVHRMPMTYNLTMDATTSNLHIAPAGTITYAPLLVRKVASLDGVSVVGAIDGPVITAASRSGVTITVAIACDGGTDFTPTTAIQGFRFYDVIAEIAITSAVRTNATTITLTLASAGTGVADTLYYGQGTMSTVTDFTKTVQDNSGYSLPLMTEQITLPYAA